MSYPSCGRGRATSDLRRGGGDLRSDASSAKSPPHAKQLQKDGSGLTVDVVMADDAETLAELHRRTGRPGHPRRLVRSASRRRVGERQRTEELVAEFTFDVLADVIRQGNPQLVVLQLLEAEQQRSRPTSPFSRRSSSHRGSITSSRTSTRLAATRRPSSTARCTRRWPPAHRWTRRFSRRAAASGSPIRDRGRSSRPRSSTFVPGRRRLVAVGAAAGSASARSRADGAEAHPEVRRAGGAALVLAGARALAARHRQAVRRRSHEREVRARGRICVTPSPPMTTTDARTVSA